MVHAPIAERSAVEHADERATRRDDTHHGRRRDDAVNATMILDHVGFNVSDFAASKRFYDAALAPLGIGVAAEGEGWVMLGREGKPQFWFGSFGASPGPIHIAFAAANREQVRQFHAAGVVMAVNGNGAPGLRQALRGKENGAVGIGPD